MRTLSASLVFLCIGLTGCIGAIRLPERTRGQQGQAQKIDLDFLKAGQTSRAEVLQKLKPFDTGVDSQRFFVGRWDTSRWGAWAILAGYYSAAATAGRIWRDQNLLIEFDDQGVVKRFETFSDKSFVARIGPVIREAAFSADQPLDVLANFDSRNYVSVNLLLSADTIEFTETQKANKPMHFRVPRRWLKGTHTFLTPSSDAVHGSVQLRFSANLKSIGGPRTRNISVQTTISQLVTLLRYATPQGQPTPANVQLPK